MIRNFIRKTKIYIRDPSNLEDVGIEGLTACKLDTNIKNEKAA